MAELGVVLIGYIVVFLLVIGPAIGGVSGFHRPAVDLTNGIGRETPTGVRGGILVLTSALVMIGFRAGPEASLVMVDTPRRTRAVIAVFPVIVERWLGVGL